MADRPGSYRSRQNVSRHTLVMRKAKDDDAERIARQDEEGAPSGNRTRVLSTRMPSSRAPGTPESAEARISRRDRTVSGRTVVIHRDGRDSGSLTVSTTLSGRQASSVRVTGGDTIIRYQSGDMVIKRGTRRASLRRQLIWAYALGYVALFSLYSYFLFTGTQTITPDEYIRNAFSRRHSSDVVDLERAALEAMRGNRTPAEVRPAENISFYDENRDLIRVESGNRLTLAVAAKLGKVIIDDQKKDVSKRTFQAPFRIYKETYLAHVDWPYWLTFYNALGFFLLLLLFLWRPLMNYLGTQGKKTAVALRNARQAQDQAAEYREKYRSLAGEIGEKEEQRRADIEARTVTERDEALEDARNQAEEIVGGIESALDSSARETGAKLGAHAAIRACEEARRILKKRLGQEEHDAAIDELIADISGMRFAAERKG